MNKKVIAGLISLAFHHSISATENINLDEVVVTASRTSQARENVIGDVTVIDRQEIERMGAGSVTDLLRLQPGVQINTSGGAGTASSIFLRGTNDQHLVVLVDGLRINSATQGTTAYEKIPLSQIERIEILRGPASSLYGADAIGGVIQIFTRKTDSKKPLINAAIGLGSYDTKTAEAGIGGAFGDTRYNININSLTTNGFSAKRHDVGFDGDNDAYRNLGLTANINHKLNENHEIGAQFLQSEGDSNYDCYTKNSSNVVTKNGSICEIDQTLRSYGLYSRNQLTHMWQSTLKVGMGIDSSEDFSGRNAAGVVSYSKYLTEQRQLTWLNNLTLPVGTLTLGYERLEQEVDSTTVYKEDARNNNGYLASYLANIGNHALQLSVRNDDNSQFGNYTTGGAGYGYNITPKWRVTANYGAAFKPPTFNQLYFPNFGNPTLSPEKSDTVETGIKYTGEKFRASMIAFQNNIRNLIANAGPAFEGCTKNCPINIGKVEINGITTEISWNINENLLLAGNLTVQSPRDEDTGQLLARRGNRYGTVNLLHNWNKLQWGAEINGASTRYNDLANQEKMSGYMLVNLTANYLINPEWKLETRANNVLDKNYFLSYATATVPYNTAGSNLFVGLRYNMKP